jgi:cytochrome c oxidase subunit 2
LNSTIPDLFGGASNLAAGVDKAFIFIFSVAAFFIIGITAFMIFTVIKFNRKKGKEPMQFSGSTKLEILWTVIPLIIVLMMFHIGWKGFSLMRKVPKGAMEITAKGRIWKWEFDYGNGKTSDTLVVPVNKPVKLNLYSADVNHSLFIPAFRIKEDVVPGYKNYMWFTPLYIGEFDLFCAEYCGLDHSGMITKVKVVEENTFNTWLDSLKARESSPDPEGLVIIKANNCLGCHSLDGSKLIGPSFKNIFVGDKIVMKDGKEQKIEVNDSYLRNSILNPNDEVVKGFNKGLMQSYAKTLTKEDIQKAVDYLKTFNEKK